MFPHTWHKLTKATNEWHIHRHTRTHPNITHHTLTLPLNTTGPDTDEKTRCPCTGTTEGRHLGDSEVTQRKERKQHYSNHNNLVQNNDDRINDSSPNFRDWIFVKMKNVKWHEDSPVLINVHFGDCLPQSTMSGKRSGKSTILCNIKWALSCDHTEMCVRLTILIRWRVATVCLHVLLQIILKVSWT